ETRETPVCVLCAQELPEIAWRAFFLAGADRIAYKDIAHDLIGLAPSVRGLSRSIRHWLRYTHRAREVIDAAQDETRRMGADSISPEHLLLGIVAMSDAKGSIAGKLLVERLGIPLAKIRAAILQQIPGSASHPPPEREFSPAAERVINHYTYWEARELEHSFFIGTEHQLLGLL